MSSRINKIALRPSMEDSFSKSVRA